MAARHRAINSGYSASIAGRAARLSARVTRVAPALPLWVQEEAQPLQPVSSLQVS